MPVRLVLVLLAFQGGTTMAFQLESAAFRAGGAIPVGHTCDGADRSPPLAWKDPPAGARTFTLECTDPDAPSGRWVHWVLWNVPASTRALPEGVPTAPTLADGSRQGTNDFRRIGYGGPCPPRGPAHRYVFRLHALDTALEVAPAARDAEVLRAVEGHVLGTAELTGRYQRR